MDKYQRASENTNNAAIAVMLGQPDMAAGMHAMAARIYWRLNLTSNAVKSVQSAADCLLDAGMPDDAFDGLRIITVLLVKRHDLALAYDAADYFKVMCLRDPVHFAGAWEAMTRYIGEEEDKLFRVH